MTEENKLEGLRGWLILVGLGILFSPVKIIATIAPLYVDIFSNGAWEVLTTPGTEAYDSLWAPILIGEIVINGGLVLAWLFIAFLFFKKKSVFPMWYIGILVFSTAFIACDAFSVSFVLPDEPIFDPDTVKELARAVVAVVIWVPYMLVSKRVKATFVK